MSLQRRLVGAVTTLTVLTLGGAFAVVSHAVNRAQERQLDDAIAAEAANESREISLQQGAPPRISDRPGPAANDVGPLPRYAVIYGPDGAIQASTQTFAVAPPTLAEVRHPTGEFFDLWMRGEHLRGVLVALPARPGAVLFFGVPRTDLDGDAAFLARAMAMVFALAVAWSAAIASWFVRKLTTDHRKLAEVVHRAAEGDLSARLASRSDDREMAQLSIDLDDMITRLETLVSSQRRFIAHAAHELRSPLTVLYGELTFTLRKERDAAQYREALQEALEATGRLNVLADDLLALARLGAGREASTERVAIDDVLREAADEGARVGAPRSVRVEVEVDAVTTLGRRGDLLRLVRNLIDNAVRHSPEGSTVRVGASTLGDAIELTVQDEGAGVAAQDRPQIFEPFHRGTRERSNDGGSGLGLSIVREIAVAHGGSVTLDDSVARGARFVVTLPKA